MGANRPSLVVQKFQEIYSQERVEAYDYIVDVTGLEEDIFISAFLLDILKVRERERERKGMEVSNSKTGGGSEGGRELVDRCCITQTSVLFKKLHCQTLSTIQATRLAFSSPTHNQYSHN